MIEQDIQIQAKARILKMLQDKYPEHPTIDLLTYEYLKIGSELVRDLLKR
jgi:hypothetical protein